MARYGAGLLSAAPTSTRPAIGLYNTAAVVAQLREAAATNTTSTATAIHLALLTAAGTQTGQTETKHNDLTGAAVATAVTWSADPTVGATLGYRHQLGAAVGAGVAFTFGADGIRAASGTANGISIALENGTGQAMQVYLVWDE